VEARTIPHDTAGLTRTLAEAGFLSAEDEAAQLLAASAGDQVRLASLVERRLSGEPLAWITGRARFCGLELAVDPGVYVPRPHTELLARRAIGRLPADGVAIDLCTGCGAVAAALAAERPGAAIVATDVDGQAVACARRNGVDARQGRFFEPVPGGLDGRVDVVVGVVPYVPTRELALLQRDTFVFETPLAYDGGPDGLSLVRRVLAQARRFLRDGGAVLLELGGDQVERLAPELDRLGYDDVESVLDEDADERGVEATFTGRP
jgi:release factor glutamine methyltransferase